MEWRRYRTDDAWNRVPMQYRDGALTAELPHQPPAGKLEYRVYLLDAHETRVLPADAPVVIRFKGDVPTAILIIHVVAMFGGMLLSTRSGMEFFSSEPRLAKLTWLTLVFLFVGGFVLGPVVQWYAFGAWWTGWPIGHDLTDNKTAAAVLAWLVAVIALRKSRHPERWALAAAIITFVVFLIPHSVLGSELDYSNIDQPVTGR